VKIATFADIDNEFIQRVHSMVWCSVATIDTNNRPRSRILHPIWEIQDGRPIGWIATLRHSPKSKHLARNPYVSLAYIANVFQPVYVDCTAQWDGRLETKQRVWEMFRTTPPPLGYDPAPIFKAADDSNFGILKLTPWRIELADMASPTPYRIWQDSAGQ
jgi:uncharacterized pyridoxamine 5'-phosphate oxidase family protein